MPDESCLKKARIFSCNKNGEYDKQHQFYVQFNPNEMSVEEAVGEYNYDNPVSMETGAKPDQVKDLLEKALELQQKKTRSGRSKTRLSMNLFYNSYDARGKASYKDIRDEIKKFYPFLNQQANHADSIMKIGFAWGSVQLVGLLTNMHTKYTMFSPGGIPVRAWVDITIEGDYYQDAGKVTMKAENEVVIKLKQSGDLSLAMEQYSDPVNWRNLMDAAKWINPRNLL